MLCVDKLLSIEAVNEAVWCIKAVCKCSVVYFRGVVGYTEFCMMLQ